MIAFCKLHALKKPGEFSHKWLEKNGYNIGKSFYDKTYDKVKRLKNIYNELKHSSARIELIKFYNGSETNFAYFLNPTTQTPIRPTSISLQIREFHYLLYFISESLQDVLTDHIKTIHSYSVIYQRKNDDGAAFQNFFVDTTSLPQFYLLNEVGLKSYDAVELNNEIQFAANVITESLYDNYYKEGIALSIIFTSDGYHNTFHVPYCGISIDGDPMHPKLFFQKQNGEKCWIPVIPDKQ